MSGLTIADVEQKYGVRRRVVTELVRAGFVHPSRGPRREYRFAFRDVVLMRMAQELFSKGIAPRKTAKFLQQLQRELPASTVHAARVAAVGKELAVRHNGTLRSASGQFLIDFHTGRAAALTPFPQPAAGNDADDWYEAALVLERSDPVNAARCYREAITAAPSCENAYINLGHLLLANGQALEARIALEEGTAFCPNSALIHFNLAIAHEELGRLRDAIASYERALRIDPELADAHFNLARLHEELGQTRSAIRHLNAYRRLGRPGTD
ncbi:tetratricopeptide repeat protein [Noviherbaspirillum sp.]|uniref:tetratricopeptide repeat protein n=1 Tax=Noviherbaspirillum sp. TaxID=1926288 RepID=UPI002D3F9BD9|nr:tetratricopeptide repeat protein [Noviherbaspirillum sp.]HZW21811.1 tetratricopeptide repeat protein [Noviherbaspirillum sp.]